MHQYAIVNIFYTLLYKYIPLIKIYHLVLSLDFRRLGEGGGPMAVL